MSYCPNCGKLINDGDNFCSNCGYDIVGKKEKYTYAYRKDEDVKNDEVVVEATVVESKSKLIAGLLQLFVPFGIGRFYLGYNDIGVAQLILTFFGIGCLWTFIDGIYILCDGVSKDAKGVPLK